MSKATLTVRELKNRDTGIDIMITGCKEESGIISVKLEYRILVVTNLSCFKAPKHKPEDVVQFVINRTEDQFLDLHRALMNKYNLVELPPVSSSGMALFKDVNVRKQKEELEHFLKMLVCTSHLATCYLTLEFLGVNPIVAANFDLKKDQSQISSRGQSEHDIFEEEVEDEDLFLNSSSRNTAPADNNLPTDLFEDVKPTSYSSKIFDDQDYGGGDNEDINELLLPGTLVTVPKTQQEDNSDLFKIDDDLDDLFQIGKQKQKPELKQPVKKPTLPPKPRNKPFIPPKPKKVTSGNKPTTKVNNNNVVVGDKKKVDNVHDLFVVTDDLDTDDILKYIQQQSKTQNEDVDLFS